MEISEIFEDFISNSLRKEKIYSEIGKAVNVNESRRTCDFQPVGDAAKRFDIRLQGNISEGKGFVLIPKKDSIIAVTYLNRTTGFVSLTSEIEKIHFEAGGEDLKKILNDLIKEIKNAIILTPAGTGTVAEPTKALLDLIDDRVNKIFF